MSKKSESHIEQSHSFIPIFSIRPPFNLFGIFIFEKTAAYFAVPMLLFFFVFFFISAVRITVVFVKRPQVKESGIAIYRKEGSFRGRKVPSAEGRFLYGRKLLNKFISKIIL